MADLNEQKVKAKWPDANVVIHYQDDAWLIKRIKHALGDPVYHGDVLGKSRISAEDAWADAAKRLGAEPEKEKM